MKDMNHKAGHFSLYTQKVSQANTKLHRSMLDRHHLSMNALMILEVLNDNKNCNTPKELGKILGLKSNVVYLHLNQLVSDGYLDRHTTENDRRKITLSCTRKAKAILKEAKSLRDKFNEIITQGISPEDLETYLQVFKHMEENIDTYLDSTP